MTVDNYHSVRLQESKGFDFYRYTMGSNRFGENIKVPEDVKIVWGQAKKKPKVWVAQEIRFPKKSYTLEAVRNWIKKNLKREKTVKVEQAAKSKVAYVVKAAKEMLAYGGEVEEMKITEAFVSLRSALEKAVVYKFGKDAYLNDFSTKEVIVAYNRSAVHPIASYESGEYEKTKYKIDAKGNITFPDTVVKVTKKVSFESASKEEWKKLNDIEIKLAGNCDSC